MLTVNLRGRSTAFSWLIVALLGALEGIYGRTHYLGDWISYLNVSRAVSSLDWKGIFDPMWSPGYPILVAMARGIFPPTPEGEWHALFWLNWIIFLCAYASWRYLLRRAAEFYDPSLNFANDPQVVWTTCCIFLSFSLCFDRVSRVSPDLLVSTLFILAAAQTLRLFTRPGIVPAIALGLILGAGYWVKGVFLPFAGIFVLTLCLACFSRKASWRIPLTVAATCLALVLPFIAAISWSYGQFTLGASGSLNYAFHVNHLPHWTNWQGGPPQFGSPIHPTRQLLADLPVFAFSQPFRTTYPPYNNMAYWYQGYRHFFSMKYEAMAVARSFYFLAWVVILHPFLYALALALLATILKPDWRASLREGARRLWPLFLPAILGLATYMAVHVEDRYLGPFFLILSLLPLTPLFDQDLSSRRLLAALIITIYTAGAAAELAAHARHSFVAALHREDFHHDPQWQLAAALRSNGMKSGDELALVGNGLPSYLCSWAYVSQLRIVAEFGSLPWHIEPWDRTRFDHTGTEQADRDYGQIFWSLVPEQRARVVQAFRSTGVRSIVSLSQPDSPPGPGWRPLGDTGAWIYVFDSPQTASARQP